MYRFGYLLFACVLFSCHRAAMPLFRMVHNNKIGFIDSTGKVIVPPLFLSAGEFSEGLAPARTSGVYGYIDEHGKFVIPPQYDYATEFSEGLALVYKNGAPFYINHYGERAFAASYVTMTAFRHGRAEVKTASELVGLIDKAGKLIIDTAFSDIGLFVNGYAVVRRIIYVDSIRDYQMGIIDSLGHFLVPFGQYEDIEPQSDGYHVVRIAKDSVTLTGLLNTQGKLIHTFDGAGVEYARSISNGLLKAYFYKNDHEWGEGFVDVQGKIVLHDTTVSRLSDFSGNRCFAEKNDKLALFNTAGQRITDYVYDFSGYDQFEDGIARVSENRKRGLIDTSGRYLIKPVYDDLRAVGEGYYLFRKEAVVSSAYGLLNRKTGKEVLLSGLEDTDAGLFHNGLLLLTLNGLPAYINQQGKIVWQQKNDHLSPLQGLSLDYRLDGYFNAYSIENVSEKYAGWYREENNYSRQIVAADSFPVNAFNIRIGVGVTDTFQSVYKGRRVELFNTTADTIHFDAMDSRLYMKTQAVDSSGQWRDIEYLSSSSCGNSYHHLALLPGQYWTFTMPAYEGDRTTKMRIELTWLKNGKDEVLFSPIFEGGVNPGQFWRKPGFYYDNIMEPLRY